MFASSYILYVLYNFIYSNVFFEKKIYFHMRKNQQKNTTNKTMYKRQSKEKTIEYHNKEQNEIKERAAKMCSNALTST